MLHAVTGRCIDTGRLNRCGDVNVLYQAVSFELKVNGTNPEELTTEVFKNVELMLSLSVNLTFLLT